MYKTLIKYIEDNVFEIADRLPKVGVYDHEDIKFIWNRYDLATLMPTDEGYDLILEVLDEDNASIQDFVNELQSIIINFTEEY